MDFTLIFTGGGAPEKNGCVKLDPQTLYTLPSAILWKRHPVPPSIRSMALHMWNIVPSIHKSNIFMVPSLKLTQKYTNSGSFWSEMVRGTENFEYPFHSWLNFDTSLVWCQIFRAPSIQLFWFLYTPSIHEIVKKSPLSASHTHSIQYLSIWGDERWLSSRVSVGENLRGITMRGEVVERQTSLSSHQNMDNGVNSL